MKFKVKRKVLSLLPQLLVMLLFDLLECEGLVFILPNMSIGQPPFYTHQLVHQTWQPNALRVRSSQPQAERPPLQQAYFKSRADGTAWCLVPGQFVRQEHIHATLFR